MKISKHTKMICAGMVFFALAAAELSFASDGMEQYLSIIDRRPFGTSDKPPPRPQPREVKKQPPPKPEPELSKYWRLSTITVIPNMGIRVGLRNKRTKDSYFLGVGDSAGEITVLDADYDQEKVLIQEGTAKEWIVMEGVGIRSGSTMQKDQKSTDRVTTREDYAKRVAARRKALSRHRKVQPPKIQGEELKEHLHKLNMKYIREGKPPLPIELTPEEDAQLVKEGVLPEQE